MKLAIENSVPEASKKSTCSCTASQPLACHASLSTNHTRSREVVNSCLRDAALNVRQEEALVGLSAKVSAGHIAIQVTRVRWSRTSRKDVLT